MTSNLFCHRCFIDKILRHTKGCDFLLPQINNSTFEVIKAEISQ